MTTQLAATTVALLFVAALTQEPAPAVVKPVAPAIELLLRESRRLDAERVRGKWAELLGTDVAAETTATRSWLRGDGAGLAGAVGTVRWSATVVVGSMPVDDHALRHLGDENRDWIRRHTARIVVRAEGAPPATAADRQQAYRILGGVTAALLDTDVIAVGAAHHGTYDPVESFVELRRRLTAPDPLSAMAPQVPTSLLVLLSAHRQLERAAMHDALVAEFGETFRGSPRDLVVVGGGAKARISEARVRIGERTVMLTAASAPPPAVADFDVTPDLHCRAAMRRSRGSLYVAMHGLPDDEAEAVRRRTVARVVAALCGDEIQVLYWNCGPRLVVAPPEVARKLRTLDPVRETIGAEAPPYATRRDKDLVARAAAAARATWPMAAEHHRAGGEVGAKFVCRPTSGRAEEVWITVQAIDGDAVRGTVDTATGDASGIGFGAVVTCTIGDLADWVFERDGKSFGAHVLAALDAGRRPK